MDAARDRRPRVSEIRLLFLGMYAYFLSLLSGTTGFFTKTGAIDLLTPLPEPLHPLRDSTDPARLSS